MDAGDSGRQRAEQVSENDTMAVLAGILLSLIFGIILGAGIMQSNVRQEAVKAGAAYWASDEDGKATFKWKVNVEVGK